MATRNRKPIARRKTGTTAPHSIQPPLGPSDDGIEDEPDPAVEREIFEDAVSGLPLENSSGVTPRTIQAAGRSRFKLQGGAQLDVSPGPAAGTAPSAVTSETTSPGTARVWRGRALRAEIRVGPDATAGGPPTAVPVRVQFEQRLPGHIADIRDAAHTFVLAINDEIERLRASTPNDPQQLEQHQEFVSFLEMLSTGLSGLAAALDEAVTAAGTKNEPIFLGKAGEVVEQLNIGFTEWLTKNRTRVAGFTVRVGLVAAGWTFLHACGIDGLTTSIVTTILTASIPKQK